MNAEYLLDAVGLLDDDLIREAETCTVRRQRPRYRTWMAWAACLAVVIALGYGAAHIRMGGGSVSGGNAASSAAPSAESSAGSAAAGGSSASGEAAPPNSQEQSSGASDPGPNDGSSAGDWQAAIMVDGVVYWSTDTPVSAEVDESAIRAVTSYTDAQPEEDGQTNFDRGLTTQYAMTDGGLLVRMNGEWILFDPVPPWER